MKFKVTAVPKAAASKRVAVDRKPVFLMFALFGGAWLLKRLLSDN